MARDVADGRRARLVYSSGPTGAQEADACPRCAQRPCRCVAVETRPPAGHAVHVRRERAGRKGKTVTTAGPLYLDPAAAAALLREIKRRCGCGGTVQPATDEAGRACLRIELQGDRVEATRAWLSDRGFPSSGGGTRARR